MAKNVLQKHWNGTEWIEIHPITKAANVIDSNGGSLQEHVDAGTAHGSTSAATAGRIMQRDSNGRAQVAPPAAAADIARKDTVDTVQTNLTAHQNDTAPHSATSAATASRLMIRDAAGRAKVAAPLAADDIARKDNVDAVLTRVDQIGDYLQAQTILSGGGTIEWVNDKLTWSSRFIILPMDKAVNPSGFIEVLMPELGTVISGIGSTAPVTVEIGGIPMSKANWASLYAVHNPGETIATLKIADYAALTAGMVTPNMILIAARNSDNDMLKLGTGQVMPMGTTITNGMPSMSTIHQLNSTLNTITAQSNTLVKIRDNRNVNELGSALPVGLTFDFKRLDTVGLVGSGTFCKVVSHKGWTDDSGGKVQQMAFTDDGVYYRAGTMTAWEQWSRIDGAGAPGSATDIVIGNRTITDSSSPTGDTGTPTNLWSWLGYMIKAITGKSNWRTLPAMTIEAISALLNAATNMAAASTLMARDAAGRTKVADPVAADDVATKAYVDNHTPEVPVTSVAGKTGAVTLAKSDVGLENVDNTSDLNKPISIATQSALDAIDERGTGDYSHAEGRLTIASGEASHAEGYGTVAGTTGTVVLGGSTAGSYSHAEGMATKASGNSSHAEGWKSVASGWGSHAEGGTTTASNAFSHSEGYGTQAIGENSHAEGRDSTASGSFAHAEGLITTASGYCSHSEGANNTASGYYSHAGGERTRANVYASRSIGRYNKNLTGTADSYSGTADAFVIGNGVASGTLANAFRVTFSGAVYGLSAFNSAGADYAEYFEWSDGNQNNEDRIGFFVTMDGGKKIRKATSQDAYILGIISATPSVVGDSYQDDWYGKYVTDDWGRMQYQWVDIPEEVGSGANREYLPIINPAWDNEQEYIPREQRKEWGVVGMMGKLLVRDDGTCQVGALCKASDGGVATISQNDGYYVMERINQNIIRIILK